jgi:hypothetical protein
MRGLLGNFNHVVKPWWLPFDLVFVRITDSEYHTKVTIARNSSVPNVWDLVVTIKGWKVVGFWKEAIPQLPEIPQMIVPPFPHYAAERTVNGIRYIYYKQYRCTVDEWEKGHPAWRLRKHPRKIKHPNL